MIKPSSILIFGSLLIVLQSNKHSTGIDLTKRNYISCSPDYLDKFDTTLNGKFIVPLPGWGAYGYSISTDNDSAQFYFNQGLNMYYGYHPKEAIASFKEAARFDPACPMAYWGQVLALGPNYNSAYTYSMPKEVPGIIQLMNRTLGHESAKEKKLIEAMNSRYSSDGSDAQRVTLNRSYSQAMRKLIDLYPNDMDLKAFYVDAMMLIHPWDFWTNIGTAKEWTPELIKLCEVILKANPNHPAALHYYIHLTEASRHPEIALGNAELLKRLFPGVAHMVHMASHEYERNGLFAEGVEVNDKADADLVRYESIAKNVSLNNHAPHYFAVQAYCAFSAGMYQDGMRTALRCRNSVSQTHENTYNQYLYMMPILTLVRLGKWEEILQDRIEPDAQWLYAGLLYDFAKGLAFVYTGHLDSASNRLTLLKSKANDPTLTVRRIPFNTALQGAGIAKEILNAVILLSLIHI